MKFWVNIEWIVKIKILPLFLTKIKNMIFWGSNLRWIIGYHSMNKLKNRSSLLGLTQWSYLINKLKMRSSLLGLTQWSCRFLITILFTIKMIYLSQSRQNENRKTETNLFFLEFLFFGPPIRHEYVNYPITVDTQVCCNY